MRAAKNQRKTKTFMSADVETLIIGGGVVGLAIARTLAARGQDVMVLERHDRIGSETSSRNSEVIHAGIYYPPGSLRAKLCVAGKDALYQFAEENGVSHKRCRKLVVASNEDERAGLAALAANAEKNGVGDLKFLTASEARELEPELECVGALLSPSTGVIDSHGLMLALEGHLTANGGHIVLNTTASSIQRTETCGHPAFEITTALGDVMTCRNLIVAAGLGAQEIVETLDTKKQSYRTPKQYLAKGHYFSLATRCPFSHLIYPMPTGAWLGVHLTLDIAGRAKFGPDLSWTNSLSYAFEDEDGERRKAFCQSIRKFWPSMPENVLVEGYTGIRSKIYGPRQPVADFAIHGPESHGQDGLIALYGIESPGLTACLAIGDHVADMLLQA